VTSHGPRQTTASPAIAAAFPVAVLVTLTSLGGILFRNSYARETPNWAAQAVGQDWVDLVLAAPWLIVSGVVALRGSRRALFTLAGGFAYTVYELVIYAFDIHFNSLFLVYCAALGLSSFALAGIAVRLVREDVTSWYLQPIPTRAVGIFLTAVGALFAAAWLGDIVPAIARGTAPQAIADAGLVTNPVHVLDLSVVLPIHVIAGISLVRRRPAGHALGPIVLAFDVLMAASIAGMMLVMRQRGFNVSWAVTGGMTSLSLASAGALVLVLRRVPRAAA
jgi:hypothetical protein